MTLEEPCTPSGVLATARREELTDLHIQRYRSQKAVWQNLITKTSIRLGIYHAIYENVSLQPSLSCFMWQNISKKCVCLTVVQITESHIMERLFLMRTLALKGEISYP